ncbi:hypothetical protein ELD05_05500 [Caldicellulosiruptor changbaiensis]|uniref:SpoIIIAH-like family protein n=1 Tax=Caldicellulosiruptor changbaiensis TaxID=1222016 RepID=A0A3T0D5C6_9FIRM|nr:SpoIIIAH-like family protein [Caldicellulosiruptor changbaiensis]AZT90142.1 hypothetical protein ELD05_05500 [Caldicellulosiruptor changbaiensis]
MNKKIFIKVYNKRQITLVLLVILVIIVGIINSRIENSNKKKLNPSVIEVSKEVKTSSENVLSEIKLKREVERSKEVNTLRSLLSEKLDEDSQKLIDKKISDIVDNNNKEMICESILSSKGIGDCIVLSSRDIIYVVTQKRLSKQQAIQVQNVVMNVFKVAVNKIRITSASQ